MFGKVKYYGAKEERTQKDILGDLMDETEKGLMKLLNQAMAASGCGFPDELDQESVQIINDCLRLWKKTKELCIESLELEEKKYSELQKRLDNQDKILEKQLRILERLERR